MKKTLLVVIMFLILLQAKPQNDFTFLNYFCGEYQAYTKKPVLSENVYLGSCYANFGEINNLTLLVGESMTIPNFEPISALKLLDAKIVKTERLESGATVMYAYSPKINKEVRVDNKKVNLQIASYEDYSVIGWPLILGSF